MKTVCSLLLGFPPIWLLSALLHSMESDMNGISGIVEPTILLSVTIVGLLLYLPVLIPLTALRSQGMRGYWAGLLIVSCAVGAILAAMGSSATNVQGWLVSFTAMTLVCTFVFWIATVPGVLLLR
jgi:hypothetical protein